MADATKRLRYFAGQVLGAQDFTDEQDYILDRQRRYSRFLNAAGIIDGLEVRKAADQGQIEVRPGTALDAQGHQVVLSDPRTVSLAERKSQTIELVIAYSQEEGDPQPTETGPVGHSRFHEKPYVGPNSPLPAGIMNPLTLACVTLDANGTVTQVDETPRVYAGIHLPDGKGTTGGVILRAHTRTDPSGWQDVTYENQWERYSTEYNPAQYWKDSQGIVYLRGVIGDGKAERAFTLPDGYRPPYGQQEYLVCSNNKSAVVVLEVNGEVKVVSDDSHGVSLDGIAFWAADSSTLAAWQNVTLNNWATGAPVQYWKDSRGIVHLRGVIVGSMGAQIGDTEAGRVFTLPDGYRPTHRQLHGVCSNRAFGRVDVLPNGEVRVVSGNALSIHLAGIAFQAADSPAQAAWQDVTYENQWERYSTEYNPAQYWKDSQGIVYLRGLIKGGTPGDTEAGRAFTLPDGYRPTHRQRHGVCAYHTQAVYGALGRVDVLPNGEGRVVSGGSDWVSLDGIAFRTAGPAAAGPAEVGLDSIAMRDEVPQRLPRIVSGEVPQQLPRIVSGVVNGYGPTQAGVGFTATREYAGMQGSYEITFDPPFAGTPAVSVTPISSDNAHTYVNVNAFLASLESTRMSVRTQVSGSSYDLSFSFIAIGPQ